MKFPTFSLLTAIVFALALGGCQKPPPPADEAAIFGVIQENLRAMEQEKVDAVMATIHPRAAAYQSTQEFARMMFEEVDVKYQLSDLKVVSATPEEARVSFVQRMEKAGGPGEFRDNIVHGVHLLRPDQGKWKIYGTVSVKVTDLNGQPFAPPGPAPEPIAPSSPVSPPAPSATPALTPPLPGAVPPALPGGQPAPPPSTGS